MDDQTHNQTVDAIDVNAEATPEVTAATAMHITTPVDFLKAFHPDGPWVLTSIDPETRKPQTKTFGPLTSVDAEKWIADRNGTSNLYFAVNPVHEAMTKKAKATDVAALAYLHVDIDPRAGEDLGSEQERIKSLLTTGLPDGVPRPTLVVFSGGGYQAFWKLQVPLALDGSQAVADDAKLWNLQLERLFGADSCHNVDRIMRLPGTWNVPDAKKTAKGRTKVLAEVIEADWSRIYPLDAFRKAKDNGLKGAHSAECRLASLGEVIEPISSLEKLDQWKVPSRIKVIIEKGFHPDEFNKPHDDRSRWLFDVVCGLVRSKVPDEVIYSIVTDERFAISGHVLDQKNVDRCARKQIADAKATVDQDTSTTSGGDDGPSWRELAQKFLAAQAKPLLRYAGQWFTYRHGAYSERDDETIRAAVYNHLPRSSSASVSNVLDAAKGLVLKDSHDFAPPCWLDDREGPDPKEQLVVRNGIVDMTTGELRDHDPALFTLNALGYDYDPDAPAPERWLKFLNEVFHQDSIELVQQIGGYLLTADTSRQAIFVFVGVSGSGKSTFGRVLSGILGPHNVCSPSLSALGTPFGQQVLIGKTVAVISEPKLDKNDAKEAVARVLLNISGEDTVAIPRKNKTDWEGRLGTRIVILANTPPTLSDAAGALMRRYVVIEMPKSFVGREDPGLEDALLAERSGILKWFIDGLRKLPPRFETPPSSADVMGQVDRMGSPVKAFVADRCVLERGAQCAKDDLWEAYGHWHDDSGMPSASKFGKELFSSKLLEAYRDRIKSKQPGQRKGELKRPPRVWQGIRLLTVAELDELKQEAQAIDAPHTGNLFNRDGDDDIPF